MFDVDAAQFWRDDALAHEDNCFFMGPQVAFGIRMSDECVYAELGEEGHPWAPERRARRVELNRRYNDKAEKVVGMRLLREEFAPGDAQFPYIKRIGEVFGGAYSFQNNTEWLEGDIEDEIALGKLLDNIEKMDYRTFMLPDNWDGEKRRIYETYGLRPEPLRFIRGPVTLATSIYGVERLLLLLMDEPELSARFSVAIARSALKMAQVMDEEAGVSAESLPGYSFNDDNCCLLTPELYEVFGYPVLKALFDHYSPGEDDLRYQHSDSAMGHLLPILGRLNLTGVNFGPSVLVPEIRKHLPRARIDGCISPMTFMRNERGRLIAEVKRDCADALAYNGVNICTAGSINNGSSLESMRLMMGVIQRHGSR
jgi:uroporphyrinogen decarboxylase